MSYANQLYTISGPIVKITLSKGIIFLICLNISDLALATPLGTDYYSSGYFRAGPGISEGGGPQTAFQAPGARTKYRLGNEADTYFEAGLGLLNKLEDGKSVNTYFMVDGGAGHGSEVSFSEVPQLFVELKGFIPGGATAWVGRKYYHRQFVNMLDHAWINPGQGARGGAGLDGINLGGLNLSAAVFQYEDRGVAGVGSFSALSGSVGSTLLDLRLSGIEIFGKSTTTLLLQGAAQAENEKLGIDSENGYAAGAWNQNPIGEKTNNTLFAIYRKGSAVVQGDFNGRPVLRNSTSFSTGGYDLDKNFSFEINDTVVYDGGGRWSYEFTAGYRLENFGTPGPSGDDELHWYTAGVRPIYQQNDSFALAVEVGHDHVEDRLNGRTGDLTKLTVAEEMKIKSGYFSRPVLRWYATAASWGQDFKGLIGNNNNSSTTPVTQVASPYSDDTFGWTTGFQVETWW
jgi:maltoporin